jgi:hypothetical protein
MKRLTAVILISLPLTAAAIEAPLTFPKVGLDVPPLPLIENSLQGLPGIISNLHPDRQTVPDRMVVISRMPIVLLGRECDPKIIKTPDLSIDYKLIVKNPEIEPSK